MSIDRSKLRNKERQRRISAAKERQLDYKNTFNINDPTPYQAIKNIKKEGNIK